MTIAGDLVEELYERSTSAFERWEVLKDVVDESIDLMLNYRQSGHPGGSRSKVHLLLSLLLSGAMRWDLRRPWLPFADRFVLSAGHTVPLVYATLAVLNEVMRARFEASGGDERFAFPDDGRWALTWEDLTGLRHNKGLPGHAEMEGKTLFLKFNTGPSGHGMPPSAGEAVALKLAGVEEVKVFVVEGEGGLTPGASHETRNSAWGLGLSNLVFLVDWNDYGIDDPAISDVVPGTPETWFGAYDWRVTGTMEGSEWASVTRAVLEAARGPNPDKRPSMAWFRTRKGRGYGKYDNKSHGSPHAMNSPEFWAVRHQFMDLYGVAYEGVDQPAPSDPAEQQAQARANLAVAMSVLRQVPGLVEATSDRLLELAASVPNRPEGFNLTDDGAIFRDPRITDFRSYPTEMWKQPGEKAPNRAALATWGAWVNSFAREEYGRPLVIACSADLAESTNIAGFAKGFGEMEGWGWYNRDTNPRGTLLPQEITEFTNAGVTVGIATVNLAEDPMRAFNGFWAACSTYGSFSYLKYGPMRLFSQLAQDTELGVGKVIWVAGHSGPETAEDSRTHFGIFSPGVTQLFPEGHVIDLHPWEYNEVPVMLGAALALDVPIIALHLTRPPVEIPDRAALGMAPHWDAARGAYLLRQASADAPVDGTIYVRGTVTTANVVKLLPEIARRGLNVRIVAALSPQLFNRQDAAYRASIRTPADRWDGMAITNGALKLMREWVDGPIAEEYSLSSDFDDRWRTGGSVDEVMREAHLDQEHIIEAIERYANDREARHSRLREILDAVTRER
jgi:transketolase